MNLTAITGTIATIPRYRLRGFVPTTTFDIHVDLARRIHTFHIRAINNLAKQSRHLHADDPVTIISCLHAGPDDMPDRSIWHRVEIVADEARNGAVLRQEHVLVDAVRDMART